MGISNSPFESHLETNFIPTPSEIHNIRNLLDEYNSELDDYNTELALLEAKVSSLQKKRAKLHQQIAAHQALISPARRLPHDIIREIFVHCLLSTHNGNAETKVSQAPLLLGRICGAWRAISLSTPSLWDSIHIVVPPIALDDPRLREMTSGWKRRLDLLVPAVEEWLERSGMRPLSISLMQFAFQIDSHHAQLSYPLFNLILRYCRRWKNIKISAGCLELAKSIAELANCGITDSLPWLESLELCQSLNPGNVGGLPFIAPKLYKMSWYRVGNFTAIHFPWHQLTELVLDDIEISVEQVQQRVADLLSACACLEKLHMKICNNPAIYISHPFLKSLTLFNYNHTTTFISALHLPSLRHLAFHAIHTGRNGLMGLLKQLGGQLETLCLSANICVKSGALKYLRLTPRLIRFRIEKPSFFDTRELVGEDLDEGPPCISDQFLNSLDARYPDNVCPLLEGLYFMDGTSFTDQQLLDFILSRRGLSHPGVSKLKHMSVVLHRDREMDIAKKLSELGEDEGLTLRLLYRPKIPVAES